MESMKMKVWIGPELEGVDKGKLTMFVKSEYLRTEYITDYLLDNSECKRLYLGSGRTDVKEFPMALFDYCDDNNIEVVVESTPAGIKYLPEQILESYQVIMRIDVPEAEQLTLIDCVKVDTGKNVRMIQFKDMIHTGLETLNGDLYDADKIIYDGEVKE